MYKVGIYTVFPQLPLKLIAAEACGEAERDRLHSELSQHERNIYPLAPAAAALVQTAVDRTGPQLGHIHGVVKARIEGQCVYHSFSPCGEISLLAHRLNRYAVIGARRAAPSSADAFTAVMISHRLEKVKFCGNNLHSFPHAAEHYSTACRF